MDNLINKQIKIPNLKIRRFDDSKKYIIKKKTKNGYITVLRPQVIEKIKRRLEEG